MKQAILIFFLSGYALFAQEKTGAEQFWEILQQHCGKAYEGTLSETSSNDDFQGKRLVMHVRSCEDGRIRIPFFVGENKSRIWVFRQENGLIQLKHEHRHEDGSDDEITLYGGMAGNSGLPGLQVFPADQQTCDMLPAAATNIWWVSIDEGSFTYNLQRIGSDRVFSVKFDLTRPVEKPEAPWGWEE